jgi:hypothetical protein
MNNLFWQLSYHFMSSFKALRSHLFLQHIAHLIKGINQGQSLVYKKMPKEKNSALNLSTF